MPPDELNVIVEHEPVSVQIDEADPILDLVLISNMGPPGPPGETGPTDPGLSDHINSDLPHPVYDDGPSLTILYENAKV